MLEETETEETIGFFRHIFVIGDISIGGGGEACLPALHTSGYTQGLREGVSKGTSYPGPSLWGPGLKGPGRVQVSALSFGIAP